MDGTHLDSLSVYATHLVNPYYTDDIAVSLKAPMSPAVAPNRVVITNRDTQLLART